MLVFLLNFSFKITPKANIINGKVVYKEVADTFDLGFTEVESLI